MLLISELLGLFLFTGQQAGHISANAKRKFRFERLAIVATMPDLEHQNPSKQRIYNSRCTALS